MSPEQRTDEELAAAASGGSEAAFGELVRRFERPVFGLVLRIVRRQDVAEDVAQDTFVKAWKALGRFDPSRKFSSWLFKIAHNTALDSLRRSGNEPLSLDAPLAEGEAAPALPADPRAEDPLARTTFRAAGQALEQSIAELRPQYREILILRFVEGLAYEEIAEVMELPLGTVKVHIHRARQELARKMSALGWDPGTIGS